MLIQSIVQSIIRPIARSVIDPLIVGGGAPFNPASLFANGEQGAWYDPSDMTTLFRDNNGIVPVTASGQPVGLILDKRLGLVRGPELIANGDFSSPNLAGWTFVRVAGEVIGGELQLTTTASGSPAAYYSLATEIGKTYEVGFSFRKGTTPNANQFRIGSTTQGTEYYSNLMAAAAVALTLKFTALTTTSYISMGYGETAAGQTSYWDNITFKLLSGNHATQTTAASRPVLRDTPRRVDYDGIDDSLVTPFPSALGSACTVARSIPAVGSQILTGQTIGTSFTDSTDSCAVIIINRALTPRETASVTSYLNKAAGL